jgi:Ca2+-binding RTX toxin-like protein
VRLRRATCCLAVAGLFAAVSAPSADALTTVGLNGTGPALLAHGGAGNMDLTVSYDGILGRIVFSETGISTTVSDCIDGGDFLTCPLPAPSVRSKNLMYEPGVFVTDHTGDNRVTFDAALPATLATDVKFGSGVDTVIGGGGPDYVDAGTGADTFSGGAGVDIAGYRPRKTSVTARPDGLPSSGSEEDGAPGARDLIAADVEGLDGGSGRDHLNGNAAANLLYGNKSSDILHGGPGPDRLLGGHGADRLFGDGGNDYLDGEGLFDSLFGGPGLDILRIRNHGPDRVINCGPGNNAHEKAKGADPGDPKPISC